MKSNMKRKEEINQAAHQKYPYEGGIKGMICENSIPIFIQGAEWADRTMIEKACEWLKEYGDDFGVPESESGRVYVDDLVCEFRKAMEE